MKKVLQFLVLTAGMICLIAISANTLHAQSNNGTNGLIGKAHSAPGIAQCLASAQGGLEVNASVAPLNNAQNVQLGWRVTFYGQPRCRPGQICPLFIVLLATVDFDTGGNVVSANCGSVTTF